jgi:hypothetical protein
MNSQYFAYRRGDIVSDVSSGSLKNLSENIPKVVVAIIGKYDSMISGLHLGFSRVRTYHSDDFHPTDALIGNTVPVPVKKICHFEKHHTYETLTPPSSSLVPVSDLVENGDLVFQIGVRNHTPGIISAGVVDRLSRYCDENKVIDLCSTNTSESGSGVFTLDGKLLGMTLGVISPNVMVAINVEGIISIGTKKKEEPWFYPEN